MLHIEGNTVQQEVKLRNWPKLSKIEISLFKTEQWLSNFINTVTYLQHDQPFQKLKNLIWNIRGFYLQLLVETQNNFQYAKFVGYRLIIFWLKEGACPNVSG